MFLLWVHSGGGANFLGNIHTLLDRPELRNHLGGVSADLLGLQLALLLRLADDHSLGLVEAKGFLTIYKCIGMK